jgi:hypothetical protein
MPLTHQIQEYLDVRRTAFMDREAFQQARQTLLAHDRAEVLAHFETLLQDPDGEVRAQALEGLTLLYKADATETLLRSIHDELEVVRWVVCGCLHDYGDERAVPGLLERLRHDSDPQVRGTAASALGRIGSPEVLPDLHLTHQTDHEVDPLGHTPSSLSRSAITDLFRNWVLRQIPGTSPRTFQETTSTGKLTGRVTAEAIPFEDPEGRITHIARYAHLPLSAFGSGWGSKLDLQTSLIAPFEIEVEYTDPTCTLQRILVYHPVPESEAVNWAVHTILDVAAMRSANSASTDPIHE